MCLCLVERTGERVERGVLVVKVASGVSTRHGHFTLNANRSKSAYTCITFSNLLQYNILFKL